jgi:hypothetical protein
MTDRNAQFRGAHATRVLVAATRRNELSLSTRSLVVARNSEQRKLGKAESHALLGMRASGLHHFFT